MRHYPWNMLKTIIVSYVIGTWSYVIVADGSNDGDHPIMSIDMTQTQPRDNWKRETGYSWGQNGEKQPVDVCVPSPGKPNICSVAMVDYHDFASGAKTEFLVHDNNCRRVGYHDELSRAICASPNGVSLDSELKAVLVVHIDEDWGQGSKTGYNGIQLWYWGKESGSLVSTWNKENSYGQLYSFIGQFDCTPPA